MTGGKNLTSGDCLKVFNANRKLYDLMSGNPCSQRFFLAFGVNTPIRCSIAMRRNPKDDNNSR